MTACLANSSGARARSQISPGSAFDAIADALSPLPMWRQVLAVIGGLLAVGGALCLKFAVSFPGIAWSFGATILGIVLMAAGTGKR